MRLLVMRSVIPAEPDQRARRSIQQYFVLLRCFQRLSCRKAVFVYTEKIEGSIRVYIELLLDR